MVNRNRYILHFLVLGASCLIMCTAVAAPVADIRSAQERMDQGAPAEAVEQLKELLVDHPESPEVRFSIGCAWFMVGEQRIAEQNAEEAAKAFKESLTAFDALLHDDNTTIAREAAFNRANCILREASMIDPTQNYAEAVAAVRRAVEAYETGATKYPNHEGIRANLDYARFQLKQLLQNPAQQEENPDEQPPDTPPPALMSLFNNVTTSVPGADAEYEDNTAILNMPGAKEAQP